MRFSDFVHKLDAEVMPGHDGVCFAIPNISLASVREKAGCEGEIVEHPRGWGAATGYVTITFPMDGGAAVIAGFLLDGRIEAGWLYFAPAAPTG
jgi:hypothetical protein